MLERAAFWSGRLLSDLYARSMLDMDVVRHSPLPEGPKIIAANHPSTIDPVLLTLLVREQVHIIIDGALFEAPLLGRYLRGTGHVPVVQGSGQSTVEQAQRLLEEGQTVAIFPEGHVSPLEGGFYPPRTGTARLALNTGAPVIPVGIHIPRERIMVLNLGLGGRSAIAKIYLRGPYAITVGEPIVLEGDIQDRPYVRALSQHIMQKIVKLCDESASRVEAEPLPAVTARGSASRIWRNLRLNSATGVVARLRTEGLLRQRLAEIGSSVQSGLTLEMPTWARTWVQKS